MRLKLVLALFLALALRGTPVFARGGYHSSFSSHRSSFSSHHYSSGAHLGSTRGEVHVHSYLRHNGTFVHAHYRSHPDRTEYNNWSSKGVINPHTLEEGHHIPTH